MTPQAQPSVPESPATPIAWVRLLRTGAHRDVPVYRDFLFTIYADHVERYRRIGPHRPATAKAGDPCWVAEGRCRARRAYRCGGWTWGLSGNQVWLHAGATRGNAMPESVERVEFGVGAPPQLDEVWP